MTNLDNILQSRDITFPTKVYLVKAMVSPAVMYGELDYKESWAPKNWCFSTVVLEMTLESPLVCKEIQPIHPKGDQSWVFTGRTDTEAETPILWPPDEKSWIIWKDPDAGKDWKWEEKGTTEDKMVGWHYRLDGHEFEQALGVGDGQGSLAYCSPWGHKESDRTEPQWLNWNTCYQISIERHMFIFQSCCSVGLLHIFTLNKPFIIYQAYSPQLIYSQTKQVLIVPLLLSPFYVEANLIQEKLTDLTDSDHICFHHKMCQELSHWNAEFFHKFQLHLSTQVFKTQSYFLSKEIQCLSYV